MKSFDLNKIELYNFPQLLTKEDYQELCQLVVDDLKKNKDVLAVYLFGGQWVPGISDLDIIVVWKDKHIPKNSIIAPWELSEKAKFVFAHRYENHNSLTFKDLGYLFPRPSGIKLLWGDSLMYRLPRKELDSNDCNWLELFFVFSFLINKFLLFFKYRSEKIINVQELILFISSLSYSIKTVEQITGLSLGTNFPREMGQLRDNWFKQDCQKNIELLSNLVREAEKISLKIIQTLDTFLKKELSDFAPKIADQKFLIRNPRYDLIFIPDWQKSIFLKEFAKGIIRLSTKRNDLDSYRLVLPNSLFFFMLGYLRGNGPLSNWLKNGIKGDYKKFLDFIEPFKGIQEHSKAINFYIAESIRLDNKGFKLWLPFGFFPYQRSIKRKIIDLVILAIKRIKR